MSKPVEGAEGMEERIPDWVRDMHAYRSRHGFYRPADVLRVLGDPAKRVQVPVVQELDAAAKLEK
jgi:hypothetical protein